MAALGREVGGGAGCDGLGRTLGGNTRLPQCARLWPYGVRAGAERLGVGLSIWYSRVFTNSLNDLEYLPSGSIRVSNSEMWHHSSSEYSGSILFEVFESIRDTPCVAKPKGLATCPQ